MKLVTFQTKEALDVLKKTGILITNEAYIDLKKYSVPYDWIVHEMRQKICPRNGERYPIWAWAKCGSSIAPKKKKNRLNVAQKHLVRITFEKTVEKVLLSDYMAYSFVLNGQPVPKTSTEYAQFLKKIQKENIPLEALKSVVRNEKSLPKVMKLFPKIKQTWERIFDLKSNVHQACVWNIKMSEVRKVEMLNDSKYMYGSMNAKKSDGSRPDWKKRYLDFLPE